MLCAGSSRNCADTYGGDAADLSGRGGAALHEARADIGGFKKFLLRGNVVG
jgi:hypothetical protein